jgi:Uma2 family endonuclease
MSAVLDRAEEIRGLDALPPDALYEVIDGEAREIQPMSAAAVIVANELALHLGQARKSKRDLIVTEMLFVFPEPINRRRRPDVAYVPEERTRGVWPPPGNDDSTALAAIPTLAVEVVSPSDFMNEVEEKRIEYFAVGVINVIIVYPKVRTIHLYESALRARILTEADTLELPDVLPGFSVRVAELFAPLNRPT